VPRALFERPKTGFGVPLEAWLRGPLRGWAEANLDASRLESGGYFRAAPIREAWQAHVSGRSNFHYHLWSVLTFQAWLDAQAPASAVAPARSRVEVASVGRPPRTTPPPTMPSSTPPLPLSAGARDRASV
jgi:hypothetical protein